MSFWKKYEFEILGLVTFAVGALALFAACGGTKSGQNNFDRGPDNRSGGDGDIFGNLSPELSDGFRFPSPFENYSNGELRSLIQEWDAHNTRLAQWGGYPDSAFRDTSELKAILKNR